MSRLNCYPKSLDNWKGQHSREAIDLVEEFADKLEEIPDGGAELFPFELIEELREEYLVL